MSLRMKHFKFLAIALTILMGTTFTSCLDSDSGPMEWMTTVTINNDGIFGVSVKGDDGITYYVQNPTAMQLKDGDGLGYYPERAVIVYTLSDGEVATDEKTSYKVDFSRYYLIFHVNDLSYDDTQESKTPIIELSTPSWQGEWAGGYYLNLAFRALVDDEDSKQEDYVLFVDEVDGDNLYLKLVQTREVTNNYSDGYVLYYSFRIPNKYDLESEFGLDLSNDSKINVVVRADGKSGTQLKTEKIVVQLP